MNDRFADLDLKLDFSAGIPIYRQIVGYIRCRVALGLIEPGAALPSIRVLALELKIAPNTIARAYQELVAAGVVQKRRGFGTFVSGETSQMIDGRRRHVIEQRIDALLADARELNFTPAALVEMLHHRQAFAALPQTPTRDPAVSSETLLRGMLRS